MIKKTFLAISLLAIFLSRSFSQGVDFFAKLNVGIGLDYKTLDYSGSDVIYSPGGGTGIELGLIFPFSQFETYIALGYQQNLALQYESSTYGGTNETSFHFNRKTVNGGVNYRYYFSDGAFRGIKFGGGVNYNFPGTYSIVENNNSFGDIKYKATLGHHVNVDFVFQLRKISIIPGIKYRNVNFHVSTYERGKPEDLLPDLRTLSASGIDVSVSIVKKIN